MNCYYFCYVQTTEVTVDDLTPDVEYDFIVVPFNDNGEGKKTKKASVQTPPGKMSNRRMPIVIRCIDNWRK